MSINYTEDFDEDPLFVTRKAPALDRNATLDEAQHAIRELVAFWRTQEARVNPARLADTIHTLMSAIAKIEALKNKETPID